MNHLFAYGTLMLPEVSEKIFGVSSNEKGILKNFRCFKLFYNNEALFYPAVVKEDGAQTEGIIFRNLTNQQFKLIDEYEGDEYERMVVQVEAENETFDVWCYVWKANPHIILKDGWNLEWFSKYFLDDFLSGLL